MKEVGMTDNQDGIKATFQVISSLSLKCRFTDCQHINEKGCAVIEALQRGDIDQNSYDNYLKIIREQERFTKTVAEKRKKDKVFGKLIKNYLKDKDKNNY
jgi:ribosome biogenesis GTPase